MNMKISSLKDLKIADMKEPVAKKASVSAPKNPTEVKSQKLIQDGVAYGTGRRKNAIARVWVKRGKGDYKINSKTLAIYFPREYHAAAILKPFVTTNSLGQFDLFCTVKGGGKTGQAEAIRHGIARALDCLLPEMHATLRKNGLLTRDSRVVERKKYGKKKARRSPQFSKR
jgi:small subunit ribosomal protein S9